MKIPGIIPYRPSQVTWPSSATPDYGGDIGLIVHDGSFPYWVSMAGKTSDLPNGMDDEIDPLYQIAAEQYEPVKMSRFNGFAMYGHLVNGFFFGRFALRIEEATGARKMTADLGMARATLGRILLNGGMMHQLYEGRIWMAPSNPVLCDAKFGSQHIKWQGRPDIHCAYGQKQYPRVPCFGALLTDTFVPYSPTGKISMRATEDQMESLSL